MKKIYLISDNICELPHPFLYGIKNTIDNSDDIFIIKGSDKAYNIEGFSFTSNQIKENIYWADDDAEIKNLINEKILKEIEFEYKVLFNIEELKYLNGFLLDKNEEEYFILCDNVVYYINLGILNKLNETNYIIDWNNFILFEDTRPILCDLGLLGDFYAKDNILKELGTENEKYLLFFMKLIHENSISGKDYTVYTNLIRVENYLRQVKFDDDIIDFDKCDKYNLEYQKIPLKYEYTGFYNKTGRIYQQSDNNFLLQNLPKSKRDVLRVCKDELLVEIDFMSFEYDILCQLLGVELSNDAHIENFDKLIGYTELDNEKKRSVGKTLNYAIIYGMNEDSLYNSIKSELSFLSKEQFIKDLYKLDIYSKTVEFEILLKKEYGNKNYLINYFDRKIHITKKNAYVNYFIQSTASDFFFHKFLEVANFLDDSNRIILQQYDSILLVIKKNNIELVKKILDILKMDLYGLKCRYNIKVGNNWKYLQ